MRTAQQLGNCMHELELMKRDSSAISTLINKYATVSCIILSDIYFLLFLLSRKMSNGKKTKNLLTRKKKPNFLGSDVDETWSKGDWWHIMCWLVPSVTKRWRNCFILEALSPWQTLKTYNPSGQSFPHETHAGFHSSSFSLSPTGSLPPQPVEIAVREVQKVKAALSSFLCHPLKWNVEEERGRNGWD